MHLKNMMALEGSLKAPEEYEITIISFLNNYNDFMTDYTGQRMVHFGC